MTAAHKIASTFVTVGSDLAADMIEVMDTIWSEIDHKYGDFKGRTFSMLFFTPGKGTENREQPVRDGR